MTFTKQHPIRILHVVSGMFRAGTETWLMNILRNIDRDCFQMDFLVHTDQKCDYDDEIYRLGSQVIPCLHPSQPQQYAANFKQILDEYGPYDIIHSHVHHFSGYILRLAYQFGIPTRIAHSHNDTLVSEAKAGLLRRFYLILMKHWISCYANVGLAASHRAAVDLFGKEWKTNNLWQTLYCGVNLLPFKEDVDRVYVRTELGLPANAFVIGHVGRFNEQKNHNFLLEIAAEVIKYESNMYLLLVGEGASRLLVEQKAREMNLSDRVIFTGGRPDVPRLMLGAMDVFVLPSLYEGLGLVLIEAQAAGLPCIFSEVVPEEANVIKSLVKQISLSKSAATWAKTIIDMAKKQTFIKQKKAVSIIENSKFNITMSLDSLKKLYLEKAIKL
jgi:glycosyltransferase involved in cell wall biosynthesis